MTLSQLEQDYAYCEKIIKRSSKSFYTAFSKLPKNKANAVYAIYAFCRLADDIVDSQEPKEEKLEKLALLERELQAFCKGEQLEKPTWRALRDVFVRFKMSSTPFFDQLKGQKQDLSFQPIQNLNELKEYSYYVAGSVGLMLLPIIASEQELTDELKQSAIFLGIAMQLTNILRDVGEDYKENKRVYIPEQMLAESNVDIAEVIEKGPTSSFINLWEDIANESQLGYDYFYRHSHLYDKDCIFSVLASAKLYNAILDAVRKNNYDCLKIRNYVPEYKIVKLLSEVKKFTKTKLW